MNADGSGRRVIGIPFSPRYATWAPNGKIVFVRLRQPSGSGGDGRPDPFAGGDLYAVDPDGGRLRRLTRGAWMVLPSVSPDGSTIAAYETKTDRLVAVPFRPGGPAGTLLARMSRHFPNGLPLARWAPDGKKLVVGISPYGGLFGASLFLVDADGSGLTWIPSVAHAQGPDWRPQ
jgi:Tol biopolymer transport system component